MHKLYMTKKYLKLTASKPYFMIQCSAQKFTHTQTEEFTHTHTHTHTHTEESPGSPAGLHTSTVQLVQV